MRSRAPASGMKLDQRDAAIVKGMLARGDRQHDIAAWFGVNGGRIGEIASRQKFADVRSEPFANLPPPGPYPSGREATLAINALTQAKAAIVAAEVSIRNGAY